jgi:hypothetical protein
MQWPLCHDRERHIHDQGDQIGRFFAYLAIVYNGQFCENYKSWPNFGATFFYCKSYALVVTKMGLAAFFSQTHLVTLLVVYNLTISI